MNIFVGIIGAVVGYFASIYLCMEVFGFDNRHDPIMSGLLALFVFGPAGAIAGVYLFVWVIIGLRAQAGNTTAGGQPVAGAAPAVTGAAAAPAADAAKPPGVAKTGLKSIGIVVAIVAALGAAFAWYEYSTATPWLRGNVYMEFEIRLAEGAAIPASPEDFRVLLNADVPNVNFLGLPATLHRDRFRRDGTREVIVGEVELAFRTKDRQIDLEIKGRPEQTYPINLPAGAPHAKELGRWQKQPDGSEIRYRAKWPEQD